MLYVIELLFVIVLYSPLHLLNLDTHAHPAMTKMHTEYHESINIT